MGDLKNRSVSLTRRGWGLVGGAVFLVATGRVLGVLELMVLGAGAAGLVLAAAAWVTTRRPRLDVARLVEPHRLYAAGPAGVVLRLRPRSRRATTVWLADVLDDNSLGERRMTLPANVGPERGGGLRLDYPLVGLTRGRHRLGPFSLRVVDPFGLAQRCSRLGEATDVIVRPRIDAVQPPPTQGADEVANTSRPTASRPAGEDFAGLRAFQVGDDIRRVHWPSSARTGDLMVRQLEAPGQRQVTVVLDTAASPGALFEASVSAAASILDACTRHFLAVRLVTTGGVDSGFGADPAAHLDSLLTHLAVVAPGDPAAPARTAAASVHPGTVVLLTSRTAAPDWLGHLTRSRSRVIVVGFGPLGPASAMTAGAQVLRVDRPDSFVATWNRAVAPRRLGTAR